MDNQTGLFLSFKILLISFFQINYHINFSDEGGDKESKNRVEQKEWLAEQDLSKLDPEMLTPLTEEVALPLVFFDLLKIYLLVICGRKLFLFSGD